MLAKTDYKIVIVGGGSAGLELATRISKKNLNGLSAGIIYHLLYCSHQISILVPFGTMELLFGDIQSRSKGPKVKLHRQLSFNFKSSFLKFNLLHGPCTQCLSQNMEYHKHEITL